MNAEPALSTIEGMFSGPQPRGGERSVASVSVFDTIAAAAEPWYWLEQLVPVFSYRSFALAETWLGTVGRNLGAAPAILVAYDAEGCPLALLPLGIRRRAGLRCAASIGGRDFNGHIGFFDPAVHWDRASVQLFLAQGAAQAGIDVFTFQHQLPGWAGFDNPLMMLGGQPSASSGHAAWLAPDPEAFFRRTLSKHARKLLRHKRKKLEAIGEVQHVTARTRSEAALILDCYFMQKTARLERMGVHILEPPAARTFLEQATDPETQAGALVELHALTSGGRIVATFGGTGGDERFSGMLTSFDPDDELARCSPGELLLAEVVAAKCRAGVRSFDLGIGEARYKDMFCPEVEPLFDLYIGTTRRGRMAAAVLASVARQKRLAKQTPWLWSAVQRGRRLVAHARRF